MSAPADVVGRETPRKAAHRLSARFLRRGFKPEALHEYRTADGPPLFWVLRLRNPETGAKEIRPLSFDGRKYVLKRPERPPEGWPLYRLPEVLEADASAPFVVCEGESCADVLAELGVVATTSGGASSADGADWTPLKGRHVILWPDADKPGQQYAEDVVRALRGLGCTVEVIDVAALNLPEHGDVVDWMRDQWLGVDADDMLALPRVPAPAEPEPNAEPPESEWPELVPLDEPNLPRISPELLPTWAGEFARALATATETPPELPVAMVLSTCATAAARRLRVAVRPGYSEPCNLWLVAALPSGCRKSAVQSAAAEPLIEWEHERAAAIADDITRARSERATLEARAKERRAKAAKSDDQREADALAREAADIEADLPEVPTPPRLWTSDATPERLGAMLAEYDECLAWLSSEGGVFDLLAGRYSNGVPNLDLVLKAHAGDTERVDRGSRDPVFLRYPRLTVGLSPQPDVLRGLAAKPGFRGRGLLARFLYLLPPSPLGFRTLEVPPVPPPVAAAYRAGLRAMLDWRADVDDDGSERPHTLRLTPEAAREWLEFARTIEAEMRPGGDLERFSDWAGKAPGAAARLAGVLHGIEHAHGRPWEHPIELPTMSRALEILAAVSRHSLAALDLMGSDPTVAGARALWDWIRRGRVAQFTVREAFVALRGTFPRVAMLRETLEALVERGYLKAVDPPRDLHSAHLGAHFGLFSGPGCALSRRRPSLGCRAGRAPAVGVR